MFDSLAVCNNTIDKKTSVVDTNSRQNSSSLIPRTAVCKVLLTVHRPRPEQPPISIFWAQSSLVRHVGSQRYARTSPTSTRAGSQPICGRWSATRNVDGDAQHSHSVHELPSPSASTMIQGGGRRTVRYTQRYSQCPVARFALPVSHSGQKVIQPP